MTGFDRHAASYDEELAKAARQFGYSECNVLIPKVEAALEIHERLGKPRQFRFLDFGCGPGRLVPPFRAYFPPDAEYTGMDASEEMIVTARAAHPRESFEVASGGLPSPRRKFDLVLASGVFHHIEDRLRPQVLEALRDCLADRGVILIWEHNPLNPLTLRMVRRCPFDQDARLVGARGMARIVRNAGFARVQVIYRAFFPFALRRWDNALGWLPVGAQYSVEACRS